MRRSRRTAFGASVNLTPMTDSKIFSSGTTGVGAAAKSLSKGNRPQMSIRLRQGYGGQVDMRPGLPRLKSCRR